MLTVQTSVLVDTFTKFLGRPDDNKHVSGQFGDFDPKGWSKIQQKSDGGMTGKSHDGEFEMRITNADCAQSFLNEIRELVTQASQSL